MNHGTVVPVESPEIRMIWAEQGVVFSCINRQSVVGIGVVGMKVENKEQSRPLEGNDQVGLVCFHMIAVMQFGDWGVEASEAIRVTKNGSELFCNFPKELYIKE